MKRKFLIFAMFLFAFSIGYAANGNEEFLKGNNFLEQKKYKEAEKYFFEALKKGNPNSYSCMSVILFDQGRKEESKKMFEKYKFEIEKLSKNLRKEILKWKKEH